MIRYSNISLTPESKGLLSVRLRVQYDGSQGFPVIASARVVNGRQVVPWIAAPPVMDEGWLGCRRRVWRKARA